MPDFNAKMHQSRFPDPLGELTVLPQTPSWISGGLLLRGGEGRGGEAWDRRWVEGEGGRKGRREGVVGRSPPL